MQRVEVHKMAEENVPEHTPELKDEDVKDIREAYPLMDAVARQEGWDDPEMDSYDIYARRPHGPTT
jgi:hypothetical protein